MARWPDNIRPEMPETPTQREMTMQEWLEQEAIRKARQKAITSVLTLIAGTISASVGSAFLWNIGAGAFVFGVACFIIGLFIGLSS